MLVRVRAVAPPRGRRTARGGGPLTQLRAVPQQGRVAANNERNVYVRLTFGAEWALVVYEQAAIIAAALLDQYFGTLQLSKFLLDDKRPQ